jgi:hypothetical protein
MGVGFPYFCAGKAQRVTEVDFPVRFGANHMHCG